MTQITAEQIKALNQLPDGAREQAKLDLIVLLMEGETANVSASIYVPLLAGFAIAVGNTGIDPMRCLLQISKHAREETRRLLKDQGISTAKSEIGPH